MSKNITDPRFQKISKMKSKVQVGDRFAKVFTDSNFQEEVSALPTDKYGIKKTKAPVKTHVSRIYEYDPELDEDIKNKKHQEEDGSDGSDDQGEFVWNEESSSSELEDEIENEIEEEVCNRSMKIKTKI